MKNDEIFSVERTRSLFEDLAVRFSTKLLIITFVLVNAVIMFRDSLYLFAATSRETIFHHIFPLSFFPWKNNEQKCRKVGAMFLRMISFFKLIFSRISTTISLIPLLMEDFFTSVVCKNDGMYLLIRVGAIISSNLLIVIFCYVYAILDAVSCLC